MFFRFPYFFIIIIWAKTNKMYVNNPYCFSLYVLIPQLSWSDIIDVHPKPPFFLPYSQHRLSTNFSACEESCVTHLNVFRIFLVSSSPNKSLPIIPRVPKKTPHLPYPWGRNLAASISITLRWSRDCPLYWCLCKFFPTLVQLTFCYELEKQGRKFW